MADMKYVEKWVHEEIVYLRDGVEVHREVRDAMQWDAEPAEPMDDYDRDVAGLNDAEATDD